MIFQSFVLIFSNAYILIHLKEYFILLVLIFLIILHSIKTLRLSEKQYFIIKERTNDSRKQWYYQYLLTNDIAFGYYFLCVNHALPQKFSIIVLGILPENYRINWYITQIIFIVFFLIGVFLMEKNKYVQS